VTSRGFVASAAALAAIAVLPAAADAAGRPVFATTTPITLEPGATTTALVCRGAGGRPKASVTVDGLPDGALVIDGSTAPSVNVPIKPSTCTRLQLQAASSAAPGTGTLAIATDRGVARRTIAIVKRSPTAAPVAPLGELTLKANHHGPFARGSDLVQGEIPFGPYAPATELTPDALPAPANTVAVLQSGSDLAYLVKSGGPKPADAEHGLAALLVDLDGANSTGTYKGTITYVKDDGTNGTIAVSVLVGDSIWWCILAVVVGVLLSLLVPLISQRLWPETSMLLTRERLPRKYRAAVATFNELAGDRAGIPQLTSGDIGAFVESLKAANRAYYRSHFLVDYDADDYKKVQDLLDQKDEELAYLRDKSGLVADLATLRDAIAGFEGAGREEPRLLAAARTRLQPQTIAAGAATQLGVDARAFSAALASWPALYDRLVADEALADELRARLPREGLWWSEHLDERLASAQGSLTRARGGLLLAETPDALSAAGVPGLLDEAEVALTELAPLLMPERGRGVGEGLPELGVTMLLPSRTSFRTYANELAFPRLAIAVYKRLAESPRVEDAAVKLAYGTLGLAGYFLIVLLALAGALATTLPTVFSPTFGSVSDYLTALGIGSAAGVASKAVLDGVANMRRAPR
jgi:hypothetical protein